MMIMQRSRALRIGRIHAPAHDDDDEERLEVERYGKIRTSE